MSRAMRLRIALAGLVAGVLAGPEGMSQEAPSPPADLIVTGGPIYTGLEAEPRVAMVAIRDGRIAFTGGRERLDAWTGAQTRVIDLDGAAAYPGFVDAHVHLLGIGQRERMLALSEIGSIEALVAAVKGAVGRTGADGVVYGRGWIETHWPEGRFPTRDDLDPVSPDTPVLLVRADGHAAVANSAALKAADIDAETPDPRGGEILRDADGRPTGMLIDTAMGLAASLMPAETGPEAKAALRVAGQVYARSGWTGVHNMSVPLARVRLIEELAEEGAMPLRVYNAVGQADARELIESGPRTSADGRVTTRAIKLYVDGALGSRGAKLKRPYADRPDSDGLFLNRRAELMPILTGALEGGIQVATHAIGDWANHRLLDWYTRAYLAVPPARRGVAEPRWRVEHAQILLPEDISRFADLGVIASMQPSHAIGDLHFAMDRLGADRLAGAYAWSDLVGSGAIVAGGSDAPVEKGSPLIEFFAAVARRDLEGYQGPGWQPEQAVGREIALKMFTLWPAYAAFQESARGTLSIGKRADISVFSGDLMTVEAARIPTLEAVMTIIDGVVAWER